MERSYVYVCVWVCVCVLGFHQFNILKWCLLSLKDSELLRWLSYAWTCLVNIRNIKRTKTFALFCFEWFLWLLLLLKWKKNIFLMKLKSICSSIEHWKWFTRNWKVSKLKKMNISNFDEWLFIVTLLKWFEKTKFMLMEVNSLFIDKTKSAWSQTFLLASKMSI